MATLSARAPLGLKVTYLTPGKLYPVERPGATEMAFYVVDDDGDEIYCLWERCAHLVHLDWERVEEPAKARGDAQ